MNSIGAWSPVLLRAALRQNAARVVALQVRTALSPAALRPLLGREVRALDAR